MVLLARLVLVAGALSARWALAERALVARHRQDGYFTLETDTVGALIQTLDENASADPTEGKELVPSDKKASPDTNQDPYVVLDVSPTASQDKIKKAYQEAALKWHPDRNKSPEAEEMFKAINNAHELLSDPEKRAKFDASRKLKVEVDLPEEFLSACTLNLMRGGKNEEVIKQATKCTQELQELTERVRQDQHSSEETTKQYGVIFAKVVEFLKLLQDKGVKDAFDKDDQDMREKLLAKVGDIKGDIKQLAIQGSEHHAAAAAAA